ncbi:hypothetical protein L195_g058950, partial [Trifolium pratense]
MRTMSDLGDCFDKLVREFAVNVCDNCDDPKNPEYRQVPTTHSSNVAKELVRFIYVVGTKA